jgi:hypothetical protein
MDVLRRYMFATQVTVRERAVDSMLPQLLRNARERFLENTQPIIKFLCGEAACADIVLADKDLLRVLVNDGLPATGAAGGDDGDGCLLSASDAARLRAEWRVSMPELNEKFAVWWSLNGLGNAKTPRPPSIVSRDVFKIAEQHLGVKVERDTHARVDYMYGIKLLSSVQHGGNQNMTYG